MADAIGKAVLVQSVQAGAPKVSAGIVPVAVRLVNTSAKPIYAFKYKIVATWADGTSTSSASSEDLLALYLNVEQGRQLSSRPIFRSGEIHTIAGAIQTKNGALPVNCTATILMIAFGDRTAIGSSDDIGRLSSTRTSQAASMSGLLTDLQAVVQAADPVKAAKTRSEELNAPQPGDPKVTDTLGNRISPNSLRTSMLLGYVTAVSGDPKRIAKQIAYTQAYVEELKLHASLQAVNQ